MAGCASWASGAFTLFWRVASKRLNANGNLPKGHARQAEAIRCITVWEPNFMDMESDRVRRAISRIDMTRDYKKASSPEAVYLYQLSAAQKHGVFEPFDAEASELNAWLLARQAGRELVEAAWAAFCAEPKTED